VTELPWQKVSDPLTVTVLGGNGFTTTVSAAEVLLQPLALTVTEYEPLAVGEILCVVAPLLHK
jgi:hypothetical protein